MRLQNSSQFLITIFRHLYIYRQYVWQNMTSKAVPRFHPYKTQCFPSGTSSVVSCFSNFSDSTYFFHLTGARVQVKETAASSYLSSLLIPKSNLSNVGICIERQQLWTWSMKACHVRFVRSAWGKQRELVTPMMLTLSGILQWES